MTYLEAIDNVLGGMQTIILREAEKAAGEQHSPVRGPDESEDTIRESIRKVHALRAMRESFENLMTEVILS